MNDPSPIFGQDTRRPVSLLRCLIGLVASVFLVLAGGFIQFTADLPRAPAGSSSAAGAQADAIVVLTGGRDRIGEALRLLDAGRGARLLISGVNRDVSREALAATYADASARFDCCVDLGFEARTTLGNANETAQWARDKGYASLIVVTSNYHMPRSLHLLDAAMPDVTLIAHPVERNGGSVWTNLAVARILVSEYAKYVVTLVRTRTA